jgi:hypothetical protein
MLPTPQCPNIVREVFLSGNEPTVSDTLFQIFQVNRETGHLATMLTSAELLEDKVFMVVPAEALEWAQQSGIPPVPLAYDEIDFSISGASDLAITSPQLFASVGGKVPIIGTASGNNFDYYRLQAGQGLNPTRWFQVGEDFHTPVEDGQLAIWDAGELSGLYTLQLLVVDKDESVQSTLTQVTVDNQPPGVSIRFPVDNQSFDLSNTDTLTFQVDATDDLEIASVEFFIDDELLDTRNAPPFVTNWSAKPGVHIMRIIATDRAGNKAEEEIKFTIQG